MENIAPVDSQSSGNEGEAIYFFTVVTFNRMPILTTPEGTEIFRAVWDGVQKERPFKTLALCVLPDHLHTVWKLPPGDDAYASRWEEIKRRFAAAYREKSGGGKEEDIWQRSFWENLINSDSSLRDHFDYIHYNPVKHGLVSQPGDWPWSSFQRFVRSGFYGKDWQVSETVMKMDEE
jgi:putative transposase